MKTPYQELIERVRKIDKKAAEYLEGTEIEELRFSEQGTLISCFIFSDTPQGRDYWDDIAKKLGEW